MIAFPNPPFIAYWQFSADWLSINPQQWGVPATAKTWYLSCRYLCAYYDSNGYVDLTCSISLNNGQTEYDQAGMIGGPVGNASMVGPPNNLVHSAGRVLPLPNQTVWWKLSGMTVQWYLGQNLGPVPRWPGKPACCLAAIGYEP